MHTAKSITTLLYRNPKAVKRALVVLYERQTADEQESEDTKHQNGRGFNYFDAKRGSELALEVMDGKEIPLIEARGLLLKYAGQLCRIANGEEVVAV